MTNELETYEWDHRNRLQEVVTTDADGNVIETVDYEYDIYDRRIEKTVDPDGNGALAATTERYVYDSEHIALVFDESGDLIHRYLHGPIIDQVLAQEDGDGNVIWALTDHQGTVRDVVDSDGDLVNHISYDSFGNITSETNTDVDFRFGYTGREFDEEVDSYYYRARHYDASIGQFISEDPLSFAAGDTNLYRYVFNSPANYTDPLGLTPSSAVVPPPAATTNETVRALEKLLKQTATRSPTPAPVISPAIGPAIFKGVILSIPILALDFIFPRPVGDGTLDGFPLPEEDDSPEPIPQSSPSPSPSPLPYPHPEPTPEPEFSCHDGDDDGRNFRCEFAHEFSIPGRPTKTCAYNCLGYGALATFPWPSELPCPPSFNGNFPNVPPGYPPLS